MTRVRAPLACAGVPRELGWAQGRALRPVIRSRVGGGRWRALVPPSADAAALARDLWRHHPQLAERTAGLALGAGVAARDLFELLAREAGLRAGAPLSGPALALEDAEGGALVAALFALPPGAEDTLLLRASRPDAGLCSLETALAWLAPGFAGVNEAGLAVAASAALRSPAPGDPCRVPAFALVSDCLQRFATAEAAVEWCLRRPSGGVTAILVADAGGRVAGASLAGGARCALAPQSGLLVGSGPEAVCGGVAKAVHAAPARDAAGLAAALAPVCPGTTAVWLDPARRRLGFGALAPGARAEFVSI